MCGRCEDMLYLLEQSAKFPGSVVQSSFPNGRPELLLPDGRAFVAIRTSRGDTTKDQEAQEDDE